VPNKNNPVLHMRRNCLIESVSERSNSHLVLTQQFPDFPREVSNTSDLSSGLVVNWKPLYITH